MLKLAAITKGHGRQAKQAAILAKLKTGSTRRAAYRLAGISHDCFYTWLQEDIQFSDSVMRAEAEAELAVVAHIEKAAPEDWRAAEWIVSHHPQMRDEWRKAEDIDWSKVPTEVIVAILRDRADAGGAAAPGSDAAGGEPSE